MDMADRGRFSSTENALPDLRAILLSSGLAMAALLLPPAHGGLISAPAPGSACDNWERECQRLYGPRTRRWFACMGQPRAKFDCQIAEGYAGAPPQETPLCGNWRSSCARLYGPGTRKFGQCMNQPQARIDCGR